MKSAPIRLHIQWITHRDYAQYRTLLAPKNNHLFTFQQLETNGVMCRISRNTTNVTERPLNSLEFRGQRFVFLADCCRQAALVCCFSFAEL